MDTTSINIVHVIGSSTSLKKEAGTNGGEWAGACPFCGGKDRFRVWPSNGRYWCRQCDSKGDVIDFVMKRDNCTFPDACATLGLTLEDRPRQFIYRTDTAPLEQPRRLNDGHEWAGLESAAWQDCASRFVDSCFDTFAEHWNRPAGRWLVERGINESTAWANQLGLNQTTHSANWGGIDVWLPRGIVIPWIIGGQIWNVRIRRPNQDVTGDESKYIAPKGVGNGIYEIDSVKPGKLVVMVEAELDALLINQVARRNHLDKVISVATGGTSGGRLTKWLARLALADRVLLAFDNDGAGDHAADWWQAALGKQAARLRPTQKDPGDMWKAGESILVWLIDSVL